jgi:hypothetical protein
MNHKQNLPTLHAEKNNLELALPTYTTSMLIGGMCILGSLVMFPEGAQAAAFNIATAGTAVFDPIVKLVTDHYGKGVVAVGGAGALVMPGDLRTKAIGFGIGAGLAGLAMVAVKTGFGI